MRDMLARKLPDRAAAGRRFLLRDHAKTAPATAMARSTRPKYG